MPLNMLSERDVRQQNRRLGLTIVASLVVLYIIAIVGVVVLN
jgi:type II secretory pathway pseudopilin PulG